MAIPKIPGVNVGDSPSLFTNNQRLLSPQGSLDRVGGNILNGGGSLPQIPGVNVTGIFERFITGGSEAAGDLRDMLSRQDPQFVQDWAITMPGRPNILHPSMVEAITFPLPTIETEPIFGATARTYYAKYNDIDTLTLTLYEDQLHTSNRYIDDWRSLVVDSEGNYRLPETSLQQGAGYKAPIVLTALTANNQPTAQYVVSGCFPISTDSQTYNSETGRITLNVLFSVDKIDIFWFDPKLTNAQSGLVKSKIIDQFDLGKNVSQVTNAQSKASKFVTFL